MGKNKDVDVRLFPRHGILSKIVIISGVFILVLIALAFAFSFIQPLLGLF